MKDLYLELVKLFGKSMDDPLVKEFSNEIEEDPITDDRLGGESIFSFPMHGFAIHYENSSHEIRVIFLHFFTPPDWYNAYQINTSFVGQLPKSITSKDNASDVRAKLGTDWFRSYGEKAKRKGQDFSGEQMLAYRDWVRGPRTGPVPELAQPVRDWTIEWKDRPDVAFVHVYSLDNTELHFAFLEENERLLWIRMYKKASIFDPAQNQTA